MNYSLAQFLKDVAAGNYNVISIDLKNNGMVLASLQNELNRGPKSRHDDKSLEKLIESHKFHGGNWTRFNILLVSFLQYCRDVDPWSLWKSCDLIFNFYQNLNNCLLNDSYPIDNLVPLFRSHTEYVIPLAKRLDSNYLIIGTKRHQLLSFISSVISRLFNSIKKLENADTIPAKQTILMYIVNKINNIYFQIDSPQLCSNIFKNFRPKSMAPFREYPIKEQIEYRYLLGRYYLLNNMVTNAFVQLNSAYRQLALVLDCVHPDYIPQLRRNLVRILIYLVPTGLMIGKLPRLNLIRSLNATIADRYSELARHVRGGSIKGLNGWLQTHESELRKHDLLLVLLEKLPMITYRYLIRSVVQTFVTTQDSGRLPYNVVETAMRVSIGPIEQPLTCYNAIHDPKNLENVLVTLINLGLLRGNCFPLLRTCVVKKTHQTQEILPPIQDRVVQAFPLNSDDAWLDG
ncbi:hypothetical protein ZYGR_0H00610 [Zygosaccharomyces rouxii]|uniref:ZYRO0B05390p n=2 Tax=Zygosaccharomyces rouxii TaxID=4956 RepID=C5DR42_ZYGRC|nr:uncharacterized protein ZYRO0B05390g [Zygosaccharomyces rouxii]KAH9200201.1 hypothetical protein LQ764DRAFT_234700 [Zygosaccharomyces rouxii]GAV47220.1 hypothetical protein ZYGR_0H00610 [Zygosaccharomyces rouxii]CAR26253.1 ZYRO0B05390p [Zygosaccharomyces rouxii]